MKVAYATIVYKNRRQKYHLFRYKPHNFCKKIIKNIFQLQKRPPPILWSKSWCVRRLECRHSPLFSVFYRH